MIEIEVCQRTGDWCHEPDFRNGQFIGMKESPKYHAQIKGKPGIWACGKSVAEAVGDLVNSHPEQFNVSLTLLGKQPR